MTARSSKTFAFISSCRVYSKGTKSRLLGLGYTGTCNSIRCHFETFFMLPIGTPSFFFFVSQWEVSKMFQSDATHPFKCDQALTAGFSSLPWKADRFDM